MGTFLTIMSWVVVPAAVGFLVAGGAAANRAIAMAEHSPRGAYMEQRTASGLYVLALTCVAGADLLDALAKWVS